MNEYCSYDELREYLGQDTSHEDVGLIKRIAEIASRQFDRWCRGRWFYPLSATRYYDHPDDATWLELDADLLEVATSGFTTDNTGTTIAAADYFLMCGVSHNLTPYDRIVLNTDGDQTSLEYDGTPQQANAVTGIWGYHDDWSNAWEDSQDTVEDDPLTSSATTVTVNDADGADLYGQKPRFQEFQLLQIEDEYVYVTAVNATADELTVVRGVNGTTAASHVQDTTISVYQPMANVVQATKEIAKYLYLHKDTSDGDVTMFPEAGAVTVPQGLPITVKWAIETYRPRR